MELARTDSDKIDALVAAAKVHEANGLYGDARKYLRGALRVRDCNVDVIADIAHCFRMEGNDREATRAANRGLMFDPQHEICRRIYEGGGRWHDGPA